ncbi:MAG: hypothetical protein ABIJ96_01150 [Elusimicrobiota bacterium]
MTPPQSAASAAPAAALSPYEAARRVRAFYRELIQNLRDVGEQVKPKQGVLSNSSLEPLRARCDELLPMLQQSPDRVMIYLSRSTPDDYLFGKAANLGILAGRLALQLKQPEREIKQLMMTGWLLYTGLLRTERSDLHNGVLLDDVRDAMLQSAARATAYALGDTAEASRLRLYWDLRIGPRDGEKSESLPLFAHILDVAEVYEALTHVRPYRGRALPHDAVKYVIDEGGGGRFDSSVIKALIQSLSVYPPGSYVELNNGLLAEVESINPRLPTRPILRPAYNSAGSLLPDTAPLDLSKSPLIRIQKIVDEMTIELENPRRSLQLRARLWWPVVPADA